MEQKYDRTNRGERVNIRNLIMSIITLYVNGPNTLNKRQRLLVRLGGKKKKLYVVYKSYMLFSF